MKNIVYFDLETQKSAEDVGGWDKISNMKMSVAVTYSTTRGDYKIYGESQVEDLIRELMRADLVVGFNNLRFDYEVLHGYTVLDLTQATNMVNCGKVATCSVADMNASTEDRPWGTNNPRWNLYAYGTLNNIISTGTVNSSVYVIVWVGDDQSENDDDPMTDGNAQTNPGSGVLAMHVEAFGPQGTHKVLEVTVAKTNSSQLERGYVGQRGQDEQNRRARKSAVQTPGSGITKRTLTNSTGAIY